MHNSYTRILRDTSEMTPTFKKRWQLSHLTLVRKLLIFLFVVILSVLNRKVSNLSHCYKHCQNQLLTSQTKLFYLPCRSIYSYICSSLSDVSSKLRIMQLKRLIMNAILEKSFEFIENLNKVETNYVKILVELSAGLSKKNRYKFLLKHKWKIMKLMLIFM